MHEQHWGRVWHLGHLFCREVSQKQAVDSGSLSSL